MLDVPCDQISVVFFSRFHHDFVKHHIFWVNYQFICGVGVQKNPPANQTVYNKFHSFGRKLELWAAENSAIFGDDLVVKKRDDLSLQGLSCHDAGN